MVMIGIFILILLITWIIFYFKHAFSDPIGETIQYDNNLKIYIGGGCNSIVLTSEDGNKALIVDTKYFKGAKNMHSEVKALDITIVNTHFHMDHARGNSLYTNAFVISGNTSWKLWDFDTGHSKRPDKVLTSGEEVDLKIGDENVHIINMGRAHTGNDCIVYLKKRKMIVAGDIIWVNIHPMVLDPNGSILSWLNVLNQIETSFDIKTIVPGHGNISDKKAIIDMREYLLSIKNAIDNKDQLKLLKSKYRGMKSIPITNGFNNTVKKLKKEAKMVRNN